MQVIKRRLVGTEGAGERIRVLRAGLEELHPVMQRRMHRLNLGVYRAHLQEELREEY